MEFNDLKSQVSKIFSANLKRDNLDFDEQDLMLKLTEELGEFIQSYLIHKKKCRPIKWVSLEESKKEMAKELADVIGLVFVISTNLNIDVESVLVKKWITREWA